MSDRKREKVEDDPEAEPEEQLEGDEVADPELQEALDQVQDLQAQLDKISEEATDRVLAIEQEYSLKRRPVYKERSAILQRIPQFWCTTLAKHPNVGGMLTEDDIGVLNHCTELEVEDYEDIKAGFKITFTFEGNPYFTNKQLSKSFSFADDGTLTIKGTLPDWSPEMAPPTDDEVAASRKRSQHPSRDYRFMLWFMDEELPPGSHDELADIIREEIWVQPLKYFQAEDDGLDLEGAYEGEEGEEEEVFADQQEYDEAYGGEVGEGEEVVEEEILVEEGEGDE